ERAGDLGLGGRGERPGLLVADRYPVDAAPGRTTAASDRVHHRVQAVSDNTVDSAHSGLDEHFDQLVGNAGHGYLLVHATRFCAGTSAASHRRTPRGCARMPVPRAGTLPLPRGAP